VKMSRWIDRHLDLLKRVSHTPYESIIVMGGGEELGIGGRKNRIKEEKSKRDF